MPSTTVTTSATTKDLPRTITRPGIEIVYDAPEVSESSYTVEPHPPTPRGDKGNRDD